MHSLFNVNLNKHILKIRTINISIITRMIFNGELDRYKGIHVKLEDYSNLNQISNQEFESSLEDSLKNWLSNEYRVSWFRISLQFTQFIPSLVKFGFVFHHSKTDYVVMNKWLAEKEPKNIPNYAFTNIGVGGLVIDDEDRVLVVKERHFIVKQMWKFPGGYAVQEEDFADTAIREVLEETGIRCQFQSIIAFRHFHKFAFDCSDLYIVCHLKPLKNDSNVSQNNSQLKVKKCDFEITECEWIPIEELKPQLSKFNLFVIEKFLSNRYNNVKIGLNSIEAIVKNIDQKVYSIHTNSESDHQN